MVPSTTRSAPSASPWKEGSPGVSIRLSRRPSQPQWASGAAPGSRGALRPPLRRTDAALAPAKEGRSDVLRMPQRILIVEDQELARRSLIETLTGAGFRIAGEAASAAVARALAPRLAFDI